MTARRAPGRLENPPQGHFANVFVPACHVRYDSLCEWSRTAPDPFWKFAPSSDRREGIWVPYDVWDEGTAAMKKIASYSPPTPEVLRKHYERHDLAGQPKARVWNETEDEHEF